MINKDFSEFIELLNKNDVRYNAERIVKTLQDFGFSSLDIKNEDFLSPGYVVQLGQPPSRIDLLE